MSTGQDHCHFPLCPWNRHRPLTYSGFERTCGSAGGGCGERCEPRSGECAPLGGAGRRWHCAPAAAATIDQLGSRDQSSLVRSLSLQSSALTPDIFPLHPGLPPPEAHELLPLSRDRATSASSLMACCSPTFQLPTPPRPCQTFHVLPLPSDQSVLESDNSGAATDRLAELGASPSCSLAAAPVDRKL